MKESHSTHISTPWAAMGIGLTSASVLYPELTTLLLSLGISSLLIATLHWPRMDG